ncbi:CIA30 family protein [Christiangramia sabulilitoris]|nr:CIA30 family protein [Christiangramia sabulilitoris]
MLQNKVIFDFERELDLEDWKLVLDGVMGGLSTGDFYLNDDGYAVFEGVVSLENNGGFSSVRYDLPKMEIGSSEFVILKLKGDGKNYQFRVKNKDSNYYSYIIEFCTNKEWQEIKIPLDKMYPSFRGRKLNQPNFNHDHIDEIAILIGNKKNEAFKLLIAKIELQ